MSFMLNFIENFFFVAVVCVLFLIVVVGDGSGVPGVSRPRKFRR